MGPLVVDGRLVAVVTKSVANVGIAVVGCTSVSMGITRAFEML